MVNMPPPMYYGLWEHRLSTYTNIFRKTNISYHLIRTHTSVVPRLIFVLLNWHERPNIEPLFLEQCLHKDLTPGCQVHVKSIYILQLLNCFSGRTSRQAFHLNLQQVHVTICPRKHWIQHNINVVSSQITEKYTIWHRLGASDGTSNKKNLVISPLFNGPEILTVGV